MSHYATVAVAATQEIESLLTARGITHNLTQQDICKAICDGIKKVRCEEQQTLGHAILRFDER